MSHWEDAGTWTGDGIRREVFFFDSGGTQLYGSLYSALEPSRSVGVLACSSWGVEADRSDPLVRSVALAAARGGGAAMVFHYPGYGDSYGDLASVAMSDLIDAVVHAHEEASRRRPHIEWLLAGYMFGAGVACMAQARVDSSGLLLVQPALRPGGYLKWLADHGRRKPLRFAISEGMAYGYPLPSAILRRAAEIDAAAEEAIAALDVEATVIRHVRPAEQDALPEDFDLVEVEGNWRFGATLHPELVEGAAVWMDRRAREVAKT